MCSPGGSSLAAFSARLTFNLRAIELPLTAPCRPRRDNANGVATMGGYHRDERAAHQADRHVSPLTDRVRRQERVGGGIVEHLFCIIEVDPVFGDVRAALVFVPFERSKAAGVFIGHG